MQKLDINLGGGMQFSNPEYALFDLSLPLEKNIGIILLKANLVDSLDEMFNERPNYTLILDGRDLRQLELKEPDKINAILSKQGNVIELKKYEEEKVDL